MTTALSPASSQELSDQGDSVTIGSNRCPICKQRVTSRVDDPSTAVTAKRFLQLKHATDPEAYHRVTKAHPVRRNFLSRVAAREILTDFSDGHDQDDEEGDASEANRQVYLAWLGQQFK